MLSNLCAFPIRSLISEQFACIITLLCNNAHLHAGGVLQGFMFPYNLGRLGNGISWWLGIHPYELFFYVFLPPLLCDSAVRIDFFLFKQVCHLHIKHSCSA